MENFYYKILYWSKRNLVVHSDGLYESKLFLILIGMSISGPLILQGVLMSVVAFYSLLCIGLYAHYFVQLSIGGDVVLKDITGEIVDVVDLYYGNNSNLVYETLRKRGYVFSTLNSSTFIVIINKAHTFHIVSGRFEDVYDFIVHGSFVAQNMDSKKHFMLFKDLQFLICNN